ncbi:hypothetical protein EW146_g8626 [Bondarzewia mesenterica]|uniref:Uncharacterized protein n=1 Tax=Bondarzewia mesenterica TaxID=1095465 RepID=A0A4S4LCY1_9AGAM|nr:hypothetical protein EW146_g8626 [Bondarzewia mesenterica]
MIQRVLDATEMREAEMTGDEPLPTVFAMTSPLAEATVVGCARGIVGGFHSMPPALVDEDEERDGAKLLQSIPPKESIVWVSDRAAKDDDDVLVTVNTKERRLTLWRYTYIKPKDAPVAQARPRNRKKRASMHGGSVGDRRHSMGGNNSFDWAAAPLVEDHPLEKTPPTDFRPLPPLSALPGMPPSLSTTMTMASLVNGETSSNSQMTQPGHTRVRRNSLGRKELSVTMDQMALGGRLEADASLGPMDHTRMRATFWVAKLHSMDISESDSHFSLFISSIPNLRNISVALFDQRWDGKADRSLLAICLPSSQIVSIFSLIKSAEDRMIKVTPGAGSADFEAERSTGDIADFSPMDVDSVVLSPDVPNPVRLKNGVHSIVTIEFADRSTRAHSLDYVPRDLLTDQCLQVLAITLPADWSWNIHFKFLDLWIKRERALSEDVEFECFCIALSEAFGLDQFRTGGPDEETSAWEHLSSSPSAFRFGEDPLPQNRPNRLLAPVLNALHTLGEDIRLMVSRYGSLLRLAKLICTIALIVRPEWVDYWKRICPDAMPGWCSAGLMGSVTLSRTQVRGRRLPVWPPDMSAIFFGRLSNPDWKLPWYDTNKLASTFNIKPSFAYGRVEPLAYLRQVTAIYRCLADKTVEDSRKRAENAMQIMVKAHLGLDFLNHLPLGLAAPLREVARTCQLSPGQDWTAAAYEFVGRNDLAEGAHADLDAMATGSYRSVKDYLGSRRRRSVRAFVEEATAAALGEYHAVSGVELNLDDFTHIRFGQDKRLEEVARMLRSSEAPVVKMIERPELNEHDQAKEQQNQVLRIAERTLALPLGRAMFTFGSVPTVTREAYAIPKMEYSIRLQPQNVVIAPEPYKIPPESLNWGDFHNGVAAALRVSPSSGMIDSSWIKFNKPSELTPEHAGFLYGLGLTGHLKEMLTWHTFGYLTPKHDLTSIGVLLGLSAANVGTGNRHVTKLLAVHTPALLPTPSIDLNVPLVTQTAGLVGIGLLFMGTKHRRMAEVCLKQISRGDLNQPDLSNEHREAYTMAAALAFGMVMLGKGSTAIIPADEALVSELRILIHGEAPSHLRPGRARPAFDINLTSPAATIALGLMYLKTESQEVADMLTVPDTVLALNRIPPSFLLLRTLSRALIMWDSILPTQEWLTSQVPKSIAKAVEGREEGKPVDDAVDLAFYNIVAGCCFAIALKFAGTAREEPYILLINYYDMFSRLAYTNGPAFDHRIKRHAIRDGLNLISIALNMVMAGTGEINCLRRLRYSYGMYNQAMRYGTHMATHMSLGLLFLGGGRFTLGNSDAAVACMIAAFFPRFVPLSSDNKSYLQALRHLWVLAVEPRCLIARDVDTKEIVYLPVKIKVKEEKETGVAQLISPTLIPDFDRLLSIRVDTPRYWPFYLDLAHLSRHKESLLLSQTIYVKRRTAFLSYLEDPKGSRSLFVRSGASTGDAATLDFPRLTDTKAHPASDLNQFISSFSNDPFFLSFADHFCREDGETEEERLFHTYCHASLLDSILQDKPQTLQSHILLYRYRTMSSSSRYFHLRLQDLRFAADFYNKVFDRRFSGRLEGNGRTPLIRDSTLSGVLYALDQQLETIRTDPSFLRMLGQYARGNPVMGFDASSLEASRRLAWYLLRNNVPVSTLLFVMLDLAQQAEGHCLSVPPPDGTSDAVGLGIGVREVLHTTGTQMTTTLGSGWSMRSLNEMMRAWKHS